jgi:hypothetical protein
MMRHGMWDQWDVKHLQAKIKGSYDARKDRRIKKG